MVALVGAKMANEHLGEGLCDAASIDRPGLRSELDDAAPVWAGLLTDTL